MLKLVSGRSRRRQNPDRSGGEKHLRHGVSGMPADVNLCAVPARQRIGLQHGFRLSLGHDPAAVQEHDAIRPQRCQVEVVQHRAHVQMSPAGQGFQQAQQMLLVIEIQRGRRFIKKQPAARRTVAPELSQRAGELNALLLAAGERGKLPARQR